MPFCLLYKGLCIPPTRRSLYRVRGLPGVEIETIHERIRDLCARAVTAEEPEVESLLVELRAALRQHAQIVRDMATRALSRSSSANAAD